MDRVVTDILGPLPVTDNGNKYILLVMDQFSKWVEAYPIPDSTAETVANEIVYEFVSRFGCPLDLHSIKVEIMDLICSKKSASC